MPKASSVNPLNQRSRTKANPVDLGVFSELTIRELKGRIGAMNTGQTRPLSTNDGTGFAFQNVWFKFKCTVPFYIIFIKPSYRDSKYIDLSFYNLNDLRTNLALPILRDPNEPFYWCHAGASNSDVYNFVENEYTTDNLDKGYSSRYPLAPGEYLIKLSTQRWDVFRYIQYFVIETPVIENFIRLESADDEEDYLLLENSTVDIPVFLSDENTVNEASDIRKVRSHSKRRWEAEWIRTYPSHDFPSALSNYVSAINTVVDHPEWTLDQKAVYLKTVKP